MKPGNCPICHKRFTAHTSADGSSVRPKNGDLSVCIQCSALLRFDAGRLRLLSKRELLELSESDRNRLLAAQQRCRALGPASLIGTAAMRTEDKP